VLRLCQVRTARTIEMWTKPSEAKSSPFSSNHHAATLLAKVVRSAQWLGRPACDKR